MIEIEFSQAIALLVFIAIVLAAAAWINYTYREEKRCEQYRSNHKQCPYCTLFFEMTYGDEIIQCPHCLSYIHYKGNEKHEDFRK